MIKYKDPIMFKKMAILTFDNKTNDSNKDTCFMSGMCHVRNDRKTKKILKIKSRGYITEIITRVESIINGKSLVVKPSKLIMNNNPETIKTLCNIFKIKKHDQNNIKFMHRYDSTSVKDEFSYISAVFMYNKLYGPNAMFKWLKDKKHYKEMKRFDDYYRRIELIRNFKNECCRKGSNNE
jgi:hypothetical protein